jgi:hypothetical protein
MAVCKGPLFSLGASGTIADTLVYYERMGVACCREHVQPSNPNSADQQHVRGIFTMAVQAWQNTLSAANQTAWHDDANRAPNWSGFNFHNKSYIDAMLDGDTPPVTPP